MAEIQTSNKNGASKKKLSTRVDLTPLVDLGFLLITFFIFTSALSAPTAVKLVMPDDSPTPYPTKVEDKKVITLVLTGNNSIAYYKGTFKNKFDYTSYKPTGIRVLLNQTANDVHNLSGERSDLVVLIKPTSGSSYPNIVQVLDEMLINNITKYAIIDPAKEEIIQ